MPKRSGFTLIELLVVVSIITVISAIGLVSFQTVRNNALETKRKGDIDAIKKAYETKYDPTAFGGQGGYRPISGNDFATGKIPTPDGTDATSYIVPVATPHPIDQSLPGFLICRPTTGTATCTMPSPTCICDKSDQGTLSSQLDVNSCDVTGTLDDDLLTHWKFNQSTGTSVTNASSAGSSKNGTWGGTGTHWTGGKIGSNAAVFNGINDYISFSSWPGITQAKFSVSFWIYPTKDGNANFRIIGGQQYCGGMQYMFTYQNGSVVFLVPNAAGNCTASQVTGAAAINQWHFVVGTFDGSKTRLYINNGAALLGTTFLGAFNTTPYEPFVMGRADCSPGFCLYFGGRLDDMRVYSRVLTDPEINRLAAECAP